MFNVIDLKGSKIRDKEVIDYIQRVGTGTLYFITKLIGFIYVYVSCLMSPEVFFIYERKKKKSSAQSSMTLV